MDVKQFVFSDGGVFAGMNLSCSHGSEVSTLVGSESHLPLMEFNGEQTLLTGILYKRAIVRQILFVARCDRVFPLFFVELQSDRGVRSPRYNLGGFERVRLGVEMSEARSSRAHQVDVWVHRKLNTP